MADNPKPLPMTEWTERFKDIAGAAVAAASCGFNKTAIQERMELERAVMRLMAVTPPEAHEKVTAEVQRREELGMRKRDAYDSVADDVMHGRWQP